MTDTDKESTEACNNEEVEIKVIACKVNDEGKEMFQVKHTRCFWVGEDKLEKYKEFIDVFLETLKSKTRDEEQIDKEQTSKEQTEKERLGVGEQALVKQAKGKDGRYYCPECPKSFKRTYDYRMHQRTHSGTNPHYCGTCKVFFPRASKLADHFRTNVHKRKLLESGVPGKLDSMEKEITISDQNEPVSKKSRTDDETTDNASDGEDIGYDRDDPDYDGMNSGENGAKNKSIFSCEVCNLQFTRKVKFNEHLLTKTHLERTKRTEERYLCPECEQPYQSWALLKDHLDKEHQINSGDEANFNCKKCDIKFDSKNRWIAHLSTKKHSRLANTTHKASCCEKTFKTMKACFNHERVHLRTSPYHCETCDRYFLKKHHLSSHMVSCHNSERPYVCPYCARSYKTSNQLEAHLEAGHSFQCATCLIEFNCKPHLKKHLGDSPSCRKNICSRCNNMVFDTEEELVQHKQEIHQQRSKKIFTCSECGKTYCEAFKLRQHMTWHATGRYPYQCEICSVVCYKKSKLDRHVSSVHLKIYTFECRDCEASFKTKKNLDEHKYKMHEGEGFVCPICDKTLYTLKTFETHKLNHTKVDCSVKSHDKMKPNEDFDLRSLTNLSMSLDNSHDMGSKDNDLSFKPAPPDIKIPTIMTSQDITDSNVDVVEDLDTADAQMEIAEAVSVVTSQTEEEAMTTSQDQDIVTPRFKIVTQNPSSRLDGPVTIKVAPNPDGSLHQITPDTIQQLKITLSDLLSVTLQEQASDVSVNDGREQSEGSNAREEEEKTVEIVLVPGAGEPEEEEDK